MSELNKIALKIISNGKGILAADESNGTMTKRLEAVNVKSTPENRLSFREILFSSDGMKDCIGGVILYDETINQISSTGKSIPDLISSSGTVPGIKVDTGAKDLANSPEEKITEGYPRLQIKVGGRPIEIDIEVIKKVGELIKGKGIRMAVDANRGWTTRDAIRASRECHEVPFVMEQPCDTIEDLIKIRPQVNHPIYMDENSTSLNTVISAVGRGIVDGFGMKITRIGGLQPMKTFRDICESANLPHTCDDSWGGDIIAAACSQVASTVKENLLEGVWIAAPYIEGHYDEENGIQIENGHIGVSQKPGLGIKIDEKKFNAPIFSF